MAGLAVITDSGAGFPKAWYERHGILVAQHTVNFSNATGVSNDLRTPLDEFYYFLGLGIIPKTSSPNPAEFTGLYDEAFKAGSEKVLVLTGVKELNRVFDSAAQAANAHRRKQDILIVDTHVAGPAQGLIAAEAVRYFNRGDSYNLAAETIESLSEQSRVYVVVDNLGFLASSGRVNVVKFLVGSVLNVKPIISIRKKSEKANAYNADVIAKPRTLGKAVSQVADYAAVDAAHFAGRGLTLVDVAIVHADKAAVAKGLEEKVMIATQNAGLKVEERYSGLMTPVLGRQFGPGAVGVAMLYRKG